MATKEQLRKRLTERITTREEALELARRYVGDFEDNPNIPTGQFISQAIEFVLYSAEERKMLDHLGQRYDFPSDAEAQRLERRSVSRRAWWAIGISIVALLVSISVAGWTIWRDMKQTQG